MENIAKHNLTIINFFFLIFPLSVIIGNFAINLTVILLCVFTFIFHTKKILDFKLNIFDKIIIFFFLNTVIVLIINFFQSYFSGAVFPKIITIKTLLYLRYLILYIILRVLVSNNILNLKWFSFMCAFYASFVCFDIIFQYYFGKNIFGIEQVFTRHVSGVFGDELVAGGYLQKFALFCFFLPFILKQNKLKKTFIQFLIFLIFSYGIILSGNRIPFILFFLFFFIYMISFKELRNIFFIFLATFSLILVLIFNTSQTVKNNYIAFMDRSQTLHPMLSNVRGFYNDGKYLTNFFFNSDRVSEIVQAAKRHKCSKNILSKELCPESLKVIDKDIVKIWERSYVAEIGCAFVNIVSNPVIGGGIRSHRQYPWCNTHPHNYYLEILSEHGIFGLGAILFLVFSVLRAFFRTAKNSFHSSLNRLDKTTLPYFIIFCTEFFPLRTSGSFHSTPNASIIFLILAVLVSLITTKKAINHPEHN